MHDTNEVIRRVSRKEPRVIAAVRSSSGTSALQAVIVASGIIAAFYSLALGGLL